MYELKGVSVEIKVVLDRAPLDWRSPDASATDAVVDIVKGACAEAGFDVRVKVSREMLQNHFVQRDAYVPPPWAVLLSVPAAAFFSTMAAAAGKDAYRALKNLIGAVRSAGWSLSRGKGSCELKDIRTGVVVGLVPDLPDEAYEKLYAVDWSSLSEGELRYDPELGEWRFLRPEGHDFRRRHLH